MDVAKAEKKGRVFQCTLCDFKQIKKYAIKHYLKTHVIKEEVPFTCKHCDFVSLTEKELIAHGKSYGPHKGTDVPVEIVRASKPFVWREDLLTRWEQAASLAYWLNMGAKKSKDVDSDGTSLTTLLEEASEFVPAETVISPTAEVVDILPQLLGEEEAVWDGEKNDIVSALKELQAEVRRQGERQVAALREQTTAVQELTKTLSNYFYSNGPRRGLTPQPEDRPATPSRRTRSPRRLTSYNQGWFRPQLRPKAKQPMPRKGRVENYKRERRERAETLFRKSRSRSPSPLKKKMKSTVVKCDK